MNKRRAHIITFFKERKSYQGQKIFDEIATDIFTNESGTTIDSKVGISIKNSIDKQITKQQNRKKKQIRSLVFRVAASIAIIVGLGTFVYKQSIIPSSEIVISMSTISAPYGTHKEVLLTDGTIVKLNAGSSLSFPKSFSDDKRNVTLQGEAFFDVAKNPDKPFIITSGAITTTVLGTSFNIRAFPNADVVVTVVTGKVKVTNDINEAVFLEPGQQANCMNVTNKLIGREVEVEHYLAWQHHELYFDHQKLALVLEELKRTYDVSFVIENAKLLDQTIKTSYKDESIITVMEDLKFILDINYKYNKEEKEIIIN